MMQFTPQERIAIGRIAKQLSGEELRAYLGAFEAAVVRPNGMVDLMAVIADALRRLGHSPKAAAELAASALANPSDWRSQLD